MDLIELKSRDNISTDEKPNNTYLQFGELLTELKKKELSQNIVNIINNAVGQINSSTQTGAQLRKFVKKQQAIILKQTEKELKIVPKNYYRNLWLVLGFTAFGLPIGVAFGLSIGNIGLIGVGLPIGMGIGALVGSGIDKKAFNEGRQLNLEIKN